MPFQTATRAGTKALLGFFGQSGGGKTLSALLTARGLAGPDGLVMMIDTESGRGSMYADEVPGGYQVQELTAPFSSERYTQMIEEAEAAAQGRPAALVIDSFSHEWEGMGGVTDFAGNIAEQRAQRDNKQWNGTIQFGDWKRPKEAHKKMMLRMMGSNLHIICCLRGQFASRQIERKDYAKFGIPENTRANTTVIRDDHQSPIQDKNFIFEMMAHVELRADNPGAPILTKCPEMLKHAFTSSPKLSIETGAAIAAWANGGGVETAAQAELNDQAQNAADHGLHAYKGWFERQTAEVKRQLVESGKHALLKTDAQGADQQAEPSIESFGE